MLAGIAKDGATASITSIPRDSWVDIPGRGKNKINAACAFGGASLLIDTVEHLTGVRVDHFGVIDFAGFQRMVDSVGGIDVRVAAATSNRGIAFARGSTTSTATRPSPTYSSGTACPTGISTARSVSRKR